MKPIIDKSFHKFIEVILVGLGGYYEIKRVLVLERYIKEKDIGEKDIREKDIKKKHIREKVYKMEFKKYKTSEVDYS